MNIKDSEILSKNLSDTINRLERTLEDRKIKEGRKKFRKLTSAEEDLLDYYWNDKVKKVKTIIPLIALYYQEYCDFDIKLWPGIRLTVNENLASLTSKAYITVENSGEGPLMKLTGDGSLLVNKKHNSGLAIWQNFLNGVPPIMSLTITIIGVIGTILSIAQFLRG